MLKSSIRFVKFTPEELAYDPTPEETADWIPIPGRGLPALKRFLKWKRQMARLDPDIRKAFPDDQSVNEVLRKVMELRRTGSGAKRKKSA
jgi:hypothetical protein